MCDESDETSVCLSCSPPKVSHPQLEQRRVAGSRQARRQRRRRVLPGPRGSGGRLRDAGGARLNSLLASTSHCDPYPQQHTAALDTVACLYYAANCRSPAPPLDPNARPHVSTQIESLTINCVPLYMNDNVSRYFEEYLPYDAFEIVLPEARVAEIEGVLEASAGRLEEMREKAFCACMVRLLLSGVPARHLISSWWRLDLFIYDKCLGWLVCLRYRTHGADRHVPVDLCTGACPSLARGNGISDEGMVREEITGGSEIDTDMVACAACVPLIIQLLMGRVAVLIFVAAGGSRWKPSNGWTHSAHSRRCWCDSQAGSLGAAATARQLVLTRPSLPPAECSGKSRVYCISW